jgi:hypothetical protein
VRVCVLWLSGNPSRNSALGFLAAFIFLGCGGVVLLGLVYWLVLFIYGIRAIFSPQPNGVLFCVVVLGALLAWYLPEPPLREEIKLYFDRYRYEQIAEQGRPIFLAGERKCIELEFKDRNLAFKCVFVENNYAEFNIYRDVFSLVYSYDYQKPQAVDCDWCPTEPPAPRKNTPGQATTGMVPNPAHQPSSGCYATGNARR